MRPEREVPHVQRIAYVRVRARSNQFRRRDVIFARRHAGVADRPTAQQLARDCDRQSHRYAERAGLAECREQYRRDRQKRSAVLEDERF